MGLLRDRLANARERLETAREAVKALCEPMDRPRDAAAYIRYFCAAEPGNAEQLKANEPARVALYRLVSALVRAYANLANEMPDAGYSADAIATIKAEVNQFEKIRGEVKLASGDYIDLKMYEPAMRHLIDTYIAAEDSRKISAFDDLSLIELIVERGESAVEALPDGIKADPEAVAETIENNVRRLIIDESPVNPRYYERMSELLDALIAQRKDAAIRYRDYLAALVRLTRELTAGPTSVAYPPSLDRPALRALYDNLGRDQALARSVDAVVRASFQDGWRDNAIKTRQVSIAVRDALADLPPDEGETETDRLTRVLTLIKSQNDY